MMMSLVTIKKHRFDEVKSLKPLDEGAVYETQQLTQNQVSRTTAATFYNYRSTFRENVGERNDQN